MNAVGGLCPSIFDLDADEILAFIDTATEDEFIRENWVPFFISSALVDEAIEPLTGLTKSPRELTRKHAIWLLGAIGRTKRPTKVDPIPSLIEAIDDPEPGVQSSTIYALGQCGALAQSALPRLQQVMQSDDFNAFQATMAIKEIDPSQDIGPRLRELFTNDNKYMRQNVAWHLPDHLPAVDARRLLEAQYERETDDSVREAIAQALNKIKD